MIHLSMLACSTCRVSMIEGGGDAAGWSIFFLLIVILAMLGTIAFFHVPHRTPRKRTPRPRAQ